MASCSDEDSSSTDPSSWKCPLCLDSYKSPKLLPCAHTYCKECLSDLLKHQSAGRGTYFYCPSCREQIRVPSGGVAAFKNNFYLETPSPKEKGQLLCKDHPSKLRELELFCHQCNKCICLKCKLEDHSDHHTEDVEETSKQAKTKLSNDMTGLTSTISGLKEQLRMFTAEQEAIQKKKLAVEKDIQNRHRIMVSVADKCRNDALFSLDIVTTSIESELEEVVSPMQKKLDELLKLKKRMEHCLKEEKGSGMLVTAMDIYQDASGHEKVVQQLLTQHITTISRPVLRFTATADITLDMEKRFLSGADRMNMKANSHQVNVQQLFNCALDSETREVFSLFPRADNTVWIAFEPGFPTLDTTPAYPRLFTLQGELMELETSVKGRTTFTHTNQGTGMCAIQTPGSFQTYAKSRSLIKLKNHLNGTAEILAVIVKHENPLKTTTELRFSIRCGPHRAFDVDENKVVYAVVEEAQAPGSQRKVLLYQQLAERPVATYCPHTQPFQPSDVCFYKLGGHQVLLVADELNDAIHVLQQKNDLLELSGYLAPGCPLITQPTALNIDFKGCLWVACRTGDILLCEPATT